MRKEKAHKGKGPVMGKSTLKKLLIGIAAAALALAAAGCEAREKTTDTADVSLQKVLDAGQLVIGLDGGFPPMGFVDGSGEIAGFDVDVAQEVCNRLGIKLVTRTIDWAAKEDMLNSGEIDCIWSAMSITPARAETMNLSDPYMQNEVIILVPRSSDVRLPRDLKGKTVGVQAATTPMEALEASDIYRDVSVVYDNNLVLMEKLRNGELDAMVTDSVLAYYFFNSGDAPFYVLSDSLNEEGYAIGFRKADQVLRDGVQKIINEMGTDGTLGDICRKWFGTDITIVG